MNNGSLYLSNAQVAVYKTLLVCVCVHACVCVCVCVCTNVNMNSVLTGELSRPSYAGGGRQKKRGGK